MITLGHATVQVVDEPIVTQKVDMIVNPANTYLWMKHGISGHIKQEGGDEIEREALGKGPIAMGDVVLTGHGQLLCGRIAHVAVMAQDLKVTQESISQAVRRVLEVAEATRVTSLAVPSMNTGVNVLPAELVAHAMFVPMIELLPDAHHIRTVHICVSQDELGQFKATLMTFFAR